MRFISGTKRNYINASDKYVGRRTFCRAAINDEKVFYVFDDIPWFSSVGNDPIKNRFGKDMPCNVWKMRTKSPIVSYPLVQSLTSDLHTQLQSEAKSYYSGTFCKPQTYQSVRLRKYHFRQLSRSLSVPCVPSTLAAGKCLDERTVTPPMSHTFLVTFLRFLLLTLHWTLSKPVSQSKWMLTRPRSPFSSSSLK
jgi:hypothetical protein